MIVEVQRVEPTTCPALHICQGITDMQVAQLINFTNTDALVRRNTSDEKRFKDIETYDRWKSKGRTVYTLADEGQNLLGIIWLGNEPLPEKSFLFPLNSSDYATTLAMRIYGYVRGKGIAKAFLIPTLRHFICQGEGNKSSSGIWIETSVDNTPVLRSFSSVGFTQATEQDERKKIIMVAGIKNILTLLYQLIN